MFLTSEFLFHLSFYLEGIIDTKYMLLNMFNWSPNQAGVELVTCHNITGHPSQNQHSL